MFNWAKQQLANVAGTAEPIYGPSAIKTVGQEAEETKTAYTELSRADFNWKALDSTNVETESFYLFSPEGHVCLAQVIYSNVAGIRTTVQFNSKISYPDRSKPHLWCSTPLKNHSFSPDYTSFYADDCAMELSEDGTFYTIKSMNDERCSVNIKVTRTAPAFQGGKTGRTIYGTDLSDPWGHMRHAFWPRCETEGTMVTKDGTIDFKGGRALYSYAIQGMKPHHAAGRWNFVDFQGPNYSAILMEYTTPPSYGSTRVNVGGIVKDGEIVTAGCTNKATHTKTQEDPDSEWPEPTDVKWEWSGTSKDSKTVEAVIEGSLQGRTDRVDVMAEVPGFVKTIVANAAGTKPYIYQYTPKVTLKLKIGDEEISEEGQVFSEATFITE